MKYYLITIEEKNDSFSYYTKKAVATEDIDNVIVQSLIEWYPTPASMNIDGSYSFYEGQICARLGNCVEICKADYLVLNEYL